MINKFESYHGTVLSRLVHRTNGVSVRVFSEKDNASYVINDNIGLYVKYSTKRLTPWRFTFSTEHLKVIMEMVQQIQHLFIVLVCNDDGICCIDADELFKVVGQNDENCESKWISVERNKREEYLVKGSEAQLGYKISESHFPAKLFA